MANKTLLAQIKQRSDTAANWTAKNPIISDGELIIVTTNAGEKRFKIGDGEKTFTQLPYADENILSKIKNYTAGDGISISDAGVISSTGDGSGSDVFVIEFTFDNNNITGASKTFEETKQAIESNKIVAIQNLQFTNELNPCLDQVFLSSTEEDPFEQIVLTFSYMYIFNHTATVSWVKNSSGAEEFETVFDESPVWASNSSALSNSGAAYWNASNKSWEIKDIASGSDTFYFEIGDNNGDLISSKTFTEIKSAIESNKHILVQLFGESLFQATVYYMSSSSNARLVLDGGTGWGALNISSDNTITLQLYSIPSFDEAANSLTNSGLVYWNPNDETWSIKPTYKAGNGISISNDGTISVTAAKIYSGTSNAPSADLGENGDIYIQTEG